MYRIVWLLLTLTLTGAAAAEPGPRHGGPGWGPPGAEEQLARMAETLNLDDQQSAQLLDVLQRAEADREALRGRFEEEMRPEFCALHDRVKEEIRAILDPEQQALLEQHRDRMAGRSDRRGHRPPPEALCDTQ